MRHPLRKRCTVASLRASQCQVRVIRTSLGLQPCPHALRLDKAGNGGRLGDPIAQAHPHHARQASTLEGSDVIELEVEGLGKLGFGIRDELKRTWSRETRLDRQKAGLEGTTPQITGKHAPKKA